MASNFRSYKHLRSKRFGRPENVVLRTFGGLGVCPLGSENGHTVALEPCNAYID